MLIPEAQHRFGMDNEAPHTIHHHKISTYYRLPSALIAYGRSSSEYASGRYLKPLSQKEYDSLFNDGRPEAEAVRRQMFPPLKPGWESEPLFNKE